MLERNGVKSNDEITLILVRSSLNIIRMPKLGERIELNVCFKYGDMAMFYCCAEFLDENNNVIIESKSAFGCMDNISRRLLKTSVMIPSEWKKYGSVNEKMKRLSMPKDMCFLMKHTVLDSEIDYNNHMNNTQYAKICMDHMPEKWRNEKIKAFKINYMNECLCENDVYLYYSQLPSLLFIKGDVNNKRSFEAVIEFYCQGEEL